MKRSVQTNLIETCKFYDGVRKEMLSKEPNAAHLAITKLQEKHNVTVITQNIDVLHEKAGNKNVLHMHGNICKLRSLKDEDDIIDCIDEQTDYSYRPHIVFFDEYVLHLDEIFSLIKGCQLYISIGTSDVVSPANIFVNMTPRSMCKRIQVNLVRTPFSECYDEVLLGKCTEKVPELVEKLLNKSL